MRRKFGPLRTPSKSNLGNLPDGPGVYSLNTASGKPNYIGKVQRGRAPERIGEHDRQNKIPFDKFGFIPTKTKDDAASLEKKLIRQHKPPYNDLLKKKPK